MDSFKTIWHNEELISKPSSFCQLRYTHIRDCKNLTAVFPSTLVERFQNNLKTAAIHSCPSVELIFETAVAAATAAAAAGAKKKKYNPAAVMLHELEDLLLDDLPKLKHMLDYDSHALVGFPNLEKIFFKGCHSLTYFLPFATARNLLKLKSLTLGKSNNILEVVADGDRGGWRHYNLKTVARGLLQLQEIDIYDCTVLEELIAGGEVLEEDETLPPEDQLLFPWLISLKFRILPNLKRLFPINYSMEWSLLKNLFAYECGQLKIFASELRPRSEEDDIDSQQALLSIEQVIPNLEPLGLGSEDVLTIMDSDFPNDIFRSLKILSLASIQDGSTGFPSKFLLDRFPDSTT
ncbi:hypothetical protein CRG98_020912 [Punica granatum]|uniref:Disease resistance protein At4g27190-like leucine-rich repeats domain-containing protein n=1 Tax=Punica granatum TaxID=22663 RepID=A0A2I0JR35_PUNGR|nr:hypothetical protein CRG98_020912 [Punica granatum]